MKKSTPKRSKTPFPPKSLSTNHSFSNANNKKKSIGRRMPNHQSNSNIKSYSDSKNYKKAFNKKNIQDLTNKPNEQLTGEVRLNRYIANCGICSRREADELIKKGLVKVNGKIVTQLGTKIMVDKDEVKVNDKPAKLEQFVYILLNKPKNCITTLQDEKGRTTVMDYIKGATQQRVYPVGRLDRNTTGLLLLTNDGELARALSHPSCQVPKVYYAKLDRPIPIQDIEKLLQGIKLEDGFIAADRAGLVEGTKDEVGIEIHSGKNHIIKRMFKAIGYQVESLDRVSYGFLDKKGLKRGTWRYLTDKEVAFLKMNYCSKKINTPKTIKQILSHKKPLDFIDEFEDFDITEEDIKNIDFNQWFNELNQDFDETSFSEDDLSLNEENTF